MRGQCDLNVVPTMQKYVGMMILALGDVSYLIDKLYCLSEILEFVLLF